MDFDTGEEDYAGINDTYYGNQSSPIYSIGADFISQW
jgi:hypothetical protein